MGNLKSLAKETAIYGLSSIVGRFLNYLLVPVYTTALSAESGGYGVVTNIYAWVALLLVLLTCGMETGFFRFANNGKDDPVRVYSTSLLFVTTGAVCFLLLGLTFLRPIAGWLGYGDHPWYLGMMMGVVAMDAIQCIPFAYLRYKKRPVKFAALKLLFIFLNIALNLVYYVLMKGDDVAYAFLFNLVCTAVVMLCLLPELTGFRYVIDRELLRRLLAYSLPLLVLGLAGILNQVADKIVFRFVYPDPEQATVELGIYGAASKIAMVMAMMTQAFRYAYEPFVFGKSREKDSRQMYAQAMKFFVIFTLLAFLAVMFYMDVLRFLIGRDYWPGLRVVPIVMAAEIFMGIYFNLSFWYKLIDQTRWGAYFSLTGCAILVAMNVLLIPRFGYMACAWAGFAGYGTSMLLSYFVGQRKYPIPYDLKAIGRYVLLAAVLYAAAELLPIDNLFLRLAYRTLLLAVFAAYVVKHDLPLRHLPSLSGRGRGRGFLLLLLFLPLSLRADEGMWMLNNLDKATRREMKALGLEMSASQLYHPKRASLKDAIVSFGGFCSGVVVSEDGLVFTNHHCGFSSIQQHSSVEHDLLRYGFVARDRSEELPNPELYVRFLLRTEDVTRRMLAGVTPDMDEAQRSAVVDSMRLVIGEEVSRQDSTLTGVVTPYFGGNEFYLSVYRDYTDVRLVFAPPSSVGKFGWDTDNWEWPRHTGDFCVFRIYAGPDNRPADYSPDNVPYRPAYVAPISLQGYREGDFCMTLGYPGTTERYLSSFGIEEMMLADNQAQIDVRGVKQAIWKQAMDRSDDIRIKYASKYDESSNYWKNSIGVNRAIHRLHVLEKKRGMEQELRRWIQQTPAERERLLQLFPDLELNYKQRREAQRAMAYFFEAFFYGPELIQQAMSILNFDYEADEKTVFTGMKAIRDKYDNMDTDIDKEVFTAMLGTYRSQVDAAYLPAFYDTIRVRYGGDDRAFVDSLYARTRLATRDGFRSLLETRDFVNIVNDPAAGICMDLLVVYFDVEEKLRPANTAIERGERLFNAAVRRMYGRRNFYPDANSTMRLSFGTVAGYAPFNGAEYDYFTTTRGILEKARAHEGDADFELLPDLKRLLDERDFGRYAAPDGNLNVCFISNNDITGGNSGSAMFNARGELLGLAFDGNWEAMSSDILFEPATQRCIGVDVRYILFIIEKYGKAGKLIEELELR